VLPSEVAEGFLFINELIDLQPPVPTNLPVEMFKLMIGGDLRFTRKRLWLAAKSVFESMCIKIPINCLKTISKRCFLKTTARTGEAGLCEWFRDDIEISK